MNNQKEFAADLDVLFDILERFYDPEGNPFDTFDQISVEYRKATGESLDRSAYETVLRVC